MAELKTQLKTAAYKPKCITKRCFKNFNQINLNNCLAAQNWEALGITNDVDKMAVALSNNVNAALDNCAPIKTFKT